MKRNYKKCPNCGRFMAKETILNTGKMLYTCSKCYCHIYATSIGEISPSEAKKEQRTLFGRIRMYIHSLLVKGLERFK